MPASKPFNIVFIMTDQQAYELLRCNGSGWVHTPNLDKLAASACRFTHCYTSAPVCTPARAGLFTGMYPSSAGAGTNLQPLFADTRHLGQVFSAAGYTSAYVGKWHLDGMTGGYYGTGVCPDGFLDEYWYDGRRFMVDVGEKGFAKWQKGEGLAASDCWANRVSDRAIRFLEKHHDKPFFLVASFDEPHGPSSAPQEFYDMYKGTKRPWKPNMGDRLDKKPATHRTLMELQGKNGYVPDGEMPNNSPRMFGCNTYVDVEIGRVVDAVDRLCPSNTIIVYTVDHGDHMGAHTLTAKGATMYEEITRTPLIVRVPGVTMPGSVCEALVNHVDLAPTLCKLTKVPPPVFELPKQYKSSGHAHERPQFQGVDITPVLKKPDASVQDATFIEFNRFELPQHTRWGFTPIRCIRTNRYKLAINLLDMDELYDLEEDPGEIVNRIDDPALAKLRDELHDRLLTWMDTRIDPLRGNGWWQRPWRPAKIMPPNYSPAK